MNRFFLITAILTICNLSIFAQDKITDELKVLSDNEQYDKIIEQYASKSKNYSAKSLYYVGNDDFDYDNLKRCSNKAVRETKIIIVSLSYI